MTKRLIILGSTGSIGNQALEVVRNLGDRISVVGMAARSSVDRLLGQIEEFRPESVAVSDEFSAGRVRSLAPTGVRIYGGLGAPARMVEELEADLVLASMVGLEGLDPALAALRTGKALALANKEILVGAGELVMDLARDQQLAVLPVDSEHSAIFQCLMGEDLSSVSRLVLTASGGPFCGMTREQLGNVTPEAALRHPRWSLGPKVTIDSATLMNKGLEVIEARYLFDVPVDQIDVLVHPQSLVHSLVEFTDGSVKAQLGPTDMRLPIQLALTFPDRPANPFARIDLVKVGTLTFQAPDSQAFPCLRLAYRAAKIGGTMTTVLNAANEVAVGAFLAGRLSFLGMPEVVESVMGLHQSQRPRDLNEIREVDSWARSKAGEALVSANSLRR